MNITSMNNNPPNPMHLDMNTVLVAVSRPTRILWVIPQLFGLSTIAPILAAIMASILNQPALFWGLFALIFAYGGSLYTTFKDEDFIRLKRLRHKFKRTQNYRPEGVQKYVS